jgi:hypothetical protein
MRAVIVLVSLAALVAGAFASSGSSSPSAPDARVQDRCVRGEWRMSNAAANALLQRLIPNPAMRVTEGVVTAAFARGERMRYGSTHFVVTYDTGDLTMIGSATFFFEAGWQTGHRKLILDAGRSELVISKFTAIKDGKTYTVPGGPPLRQRTQGGGTPYTCSGNTLRWRVPINNSWATFRRVR